MKYSLYALTFNGKVKCYIQEMNDNIYMYNMTKENGILQLNPTFRFERIHTDIPLVSIDHILYTRFPEDLEICYNVYDFDSRWVPPIGNVYFSNGKIRIELFSEDLDSLKLENNKTFIYNGFFKLSDYEEISPTKVCKLIKDNLKFVIFVDNAKEVGLITYDANCIAIKMYDILEGYEEYIYIKDGPCQKGFLCTKFTDDFIVRKVVDRAGNIFSMVIHISETDEKSIEFYKGGDLFNGDICLYEMIQEGNADSKLVYKIRYTEMIPCTTKETTINKALS